MPGGSAEAWETLGPILKSIAAVAEGEPCVTHVGTDGAGHFVKMIHNGIEYADMQLIAEAYDLIRRGTGKTPAEIAEIFAEWNKGELESYLIEITAEVLKQVDAKTGKPLVDVILDQAGSKGTGVWTVQTALDLGIPVVGHRRGRVRPRRCRRSPRSARPASELCPARPRILEAVADPDAFVEDVRQALYASKIIAYAQGFDAIVAGAEQYGWDIKKGEIAKIWRGGCIIRAQFLNRITEAYAENPGLVALVTAPYFVDAVAEAQDSLAPRGRRSRPRGHPRRPAFSSSLAYYDGLARRAPACRARPGPARLLRSAHLQARRPRRHVPHPVVGRPHPRSRRSRRPTDAASRGRTPCLLRSDRAVHADAMPLRRPTSRGHASV